MEKRYPILILIFIESFVFYACKKPVKYADIPEIKYIKFILRDTSDELNDHVKKGLLSFSFIDGDGDIGLYESDTIPPMNTNLRISLFNKTDSGFQEVIFPLPLNYRIKYIPGNEGQNKTLKGEVRVDLDCNYQTNYNIIKYKFYIIDRAQHSSNIDSTEEITLNP